MHRTPGLVTFATALCVLAAGAGCAGGGATGASAEPAVCESFAAVQNTVTHIKDANVSENGLTALRPYVSELIEQLTQLAADAKAQFGQQADQLRASVDVLSTSVDTARDNPDLTNLGAVRQAVDGVRDTARALADSLKNTC
ncbi:hypothetical protein GCM10010112_50110 [Actinoplanes lobatus]|uniref:Secreted protein n=1 Tax=Actinoplanes lobatus TaxID=113568 RepID=A0A7W7MKW7_9ACTN|nr:hypothetical protein [Actinoplanes lobatus]MBB4754172.1 hypothetical protein [Actinoplanes lobatus]GGN77210.1 hypothetical protein GCM10010112_50110 [Actinoplanes lobatus]GIE40775.1 hypothetical protein Alo02nite_36730 [Actinoplanes lobatus]